MHHGFVPQVSKLPLLFSEGAVLGAVLVHIVLDSSGRLVDSLTA